MTMQHLPDLNLHLKNRFGFSSFKKGQEEVIRKIMEGQSVAAIFPTGAGKSLCYQLPATLLPGLTLVVSPLLSLMHDQLDFLRKHGIAAAALDSTLSREEYNQVQSRAEKGELKVLMISVERFRNERFRNHLQKMDVSLLVIDEAHCISEWGHNFRPEYLKLPSYKEEFSIRQVLLLTATATASVAADICSKFGIEQKNLIRTGFYRKNLHLNVLPVKQHDKIGQVIKRIKSGTEKLPAIIYVTLQKTAETVAEQLTAAGIPASPYHAGMENDVRTSIQNQFMDGTINCVVATIAFGMGIDKRDIRSIIHFDLPKSIEGYCQEIGRAARDDKDASCVLLANQSGLTTLENFIYGDTPQIESIRILLEEIARAGQIWEVKLVSLSNQTDMRQLPLKTALVYLEMEKVISSMYSYFSEYQFKSTLSISELSAKVPGEPGKFLQNLLAYATPRKIWIDLDIARFVQETGSDRKRAIAALEYLDSKDGSSFRRSSPLTYTV